MGGQHPRVTAEDEQRVRELHAQGLGRNEIARQIGRAQRTVSVIAARLGLEFDTTMAEKATQHRIVQLAEKRAILAEALLDDALRLSEQVWEPTVIHSFGGKDHTYNNASIDEPTAADKRALMAAATNAAEQSRRLVPPQDGEGVQGAVSMLGQLAAGLKHAYDRARTSEEAQDEGDGDAS